MKYSDITLHSMLIPLSMRLLLLFSKWLSH